MEKTQRDEDMEYREKLIKSMDRERNKIDGFTFILSLSLMFISLYLKDSFLFTASILTIVVNILSCVTSEYLTDKSVKAMWHVIDKCEDKDKCKLSDYKIVGMFNTLSTFLLMTAILRSISLVI